MAEQDQRVVGAVGDEEVVLADAAVVGELGLELRAAGQLRVPLEVVTARALDVSDHRGRHARRRRDGALVPVQLEDRLRRDGAAGDLLERRGRAVPGQDLRVMGLPSQTQISEIDQIDRRRRNRTDECCARPSH